MLGGTLAFGLVSESTAWEMLPVSPRWLCARAPAKTISAIAINARSAAPAWVRSAREGGRVPVRNPIAKPSAASANTIATISTPSWWPAVVCSASGMCSALSECVEKSQPATATAPSAPRPSTDALRRRNGTRQNHARTPTASAASAPRE